MINIVHVGFSYQMGGIEKYAINALSHLPKKDYNIFFINVFEEAENESFIKEMKKIGKIINLPNYRKHPLRYIKEFEKAHKKYQFDILHYNMASAVYLTPLIAAKKSRVKTIIAHSHNNASDKGLLKEIIHKMNRNFVSGLANCYCACSESAGRWMFSNKVRSSSDYHILYNGINSSDYAFSETIRKETRKELNVKDNETLYIHIGSFKPIKNHDFLIDIFNEIVKSHNASKLLLIGKGEKIGTIKKKVKRLGIEKEVIFIGETNSIGKYLSAADCFILPSFNEGLGMVLVEAQANGLSCVVSNGIPVEAEINKNFYRLSLKDEAASWAKKIIRINKKRCLVDNKILEYDTINSARKIDQLYKTSNKIKICHFVYGLKNGGVEKVILNYFENINREKYQLHIITQGESDKKNYEEFEENGFIIHTVTKKGVSVFKNFLEIKRILDEQKFDIIHCHMSNTNFFPLFYGKLSGVKIRINHSHNALTKKSIMDKILCLMSKMVDTNRMACSVEAAKWMFNTEKKVFILRNAIEIEKYAFNQIIRDEMRKKLKYDKNDIVIGCVARFEHQKNHDFLLELFKELSLIKNNYKLLLIGAGSLEKNIKEKANRLGLSSNILFAGTTNETNKYYQAMDIFALPSLYEGLGIVYVEAQISGLKCIASTNVPFDAKICENLTFLPLDVKQWVKYIKNTHCLNRREFVDEAKRSGYDIKKESLILDDYYQNLIRSKKQ